MKIYLSLAIFLAFISNSFAQELTFDNFNNKLSKVFQTYIENGLVNYEELSKSPDLITLKDFIANANTKSLDSDELLAFRINAYNFIVISSIAENYPISSVQEINGFFDNKKYLFERVETTLNRYEKEYLLKVFNEPRLHFVLNCGAIDCPPVSTEIYTASTISNSLAFQTTKSLDNPSFLKVKDDKIELSQIFNWYINDFGGSKKTTIEFINLYKSEPINRKSVISYYDYDWTLNDQKPKPLSSSNSDFRYVVSSTIPKGTYEFKFFNNLYSQNVDNQRSTFFTTIFSGLYGVNNRFNVGISGRFRAVSNHTGDSSPFDIIGFRNIDNKRIGLTALGPMIRYAPIPKWSNFSIQSTLTFPIGKNLAGTSDKPYIDWNGAFWNTQFFNDFTLSNSFSLFTELDFLIEDIGFNVENHAFRVSTPVTVIGSYFPTPKSTLYIISGFSPYWQKSFDYFYQVGSGVKYQISSDFEVELLYTLFRNKFILSNDGTADTFNIGLRYNLQ